MKLRFALVGLVARGGATFSAEPAPAMPLAPLGQSQTLNVENAAVASGDHAWKYSNRKVRQSSSVDVEKPKLFFPIELRGGPE